MVGQEEESISEADSDSEEDKSAENISHPVEEVIYHESEDEDIESVIFA